MAVDVVEEDGEEQVIHFDGEEMEITPEQLQRYQEEMEARQKAAQQYLQVDVDFVETSYYFLDVEKDGMNSFSLLYFHWLVVWNSAVVFIMACFQDLLLARRMRSWSDLPTTMRTILTFLQSVSL